MLRYAISAIALLYAINSFPLTCTARQPNILMICVDDLKPTIGCFGDQFAVTPNIDQLAQRGLLFKAAYCNQAVCSPSRNALMTGLRPQTLGIYDLGTHFRIAAPDATTMTQHFIRHGYVAEGMGKIYHIGHGNYDDKLSWTTPFWRPRAAGYALPSNQGKSQFSGNNDSRGPATESADVSDETYADGLIAHEAIERLTKFSKNPAQPFFLAVGFQKPHLPFVSPKKYWDLYDADDLPMPEVLIPPKDAPSYAPTSGGELRTYSDMQNGPIDAEKTRLLIHGYYAATSFIDAQLGKVIAAVDELKLNDSTIIVLWGDHGWHLGDHGMWCKHTNYEQAARIPVIIVAPQCTPGVSTQSFLETVDIFPTLAELAGLPAPANIDGQSAAKVLKDPKTFSRQFVTHVYPRNDRLGRAIRDERYRLVEWKVPGDKALNAEIELYDYQTDPLETKNVAEQFPSIVAAMREKLSQQPEAKSSLKVKQNTAPSAKPPQSVSPDRSAMFKRRDQNNDGYLTLEEFLTGQPDPERAPARFPRFDTNGDGQLTVEEFVKSGK